MKLKPIDGNCSGCRTCTLACSLENFGQVNPTLAALAVEGRFPAPGDYRLHLCDQCGACAEACPEEAISEKNGVWLIDADLCTYCLACVEACPNQVMFIHPAAETPIKCTLCGLCAEVCPRGALYLEGLPQAAGQGGA